LGEKTRERAYVPGIQPGETLSDLPIRGRKKAGGPAVAGSLGGERGFVGRGRLGAYNQVSFGAGGPGTSWLGLEKGGKQKPGGERWRNRVQKSWWANWSCRTRKVGGGKCGDGGTALVELRQRVSRTVALR